MNKHICKAKRIFDDQLVIGFYVAVPWEDGDELAHLIIDLSAEYKGSGEFTWDSVHRVDPDTVCAVNNTELMEGQDEFYNNKSQRCFTTLR
jgi:hypothetical protein